MRESNYWLRICEKVNISDKILCEELLKESSELKNILGSISSKIK